MHSGRLPWELQRQKPFCRRSPVSKAFLGLSDMEQQVREVQSKLLPNCLLCPGRSGYGVRVAPQRPARTRQPCVARGQSGVTTPEPSRAHETFTAASQLAVGSDAGIAEIPDMSHGLSEVFDPRYFQRTRYGTLLTGSCQTCTNDWRRDVVLGPSLQVVNSRLVHQSPKRTMSSLSLPDLKVRFEGSSCCSQCWRSRRTACQARNSLPSGLFSLICG